MRLRTSCQFGFFIDLPTPFVFMLRPRSIASQWVTKEEYSIEPNVQVNEFTDIYGNLCQRLLAAPGDLTVRTSAEVTTADRFDEAPGAPFVLIQDLPQEVLIHLLPSRYCESECFHEMTTEIVSGQVHGYDQVVAINSWVKNNIQFRPGTGMVSISATQVNMNRQGVCRDLTHLAIAMCRSISIPARMVVGYLYGLQPMDLHAWFEAYVGGRWYGFDPTQANPGGGYVAVAFGRDAADVAIYNQFGPAVFPVSQSVTVEQLFY
jgi:transglutaminase-like putative cysteine protease